MLALLRAPRLANFFDHLLNKPLSTTDQNSLLQKLSLQEILQLHRKLVSPHSYPRTYSFIQSQRIVASRGTLHENIVTIYNKAINNLQTITLKNLDHLLFNDEILLYSYSLSLHQEEDHLKKTLYSNLEPNAEKWDILINDLLEMHKPDLSLELVKSNFCQEMLKREPAIRSRLAMNALFYHQAPLFNCLKNELSYYSNVLDKGEGSFGYFLMGAARGNFVDGLDLLPKTYIKTLPPTGQKYSLDAVIKHIAILGHVSFLKALIARGCQINKIPSESLQDMINCAKEFNHSEVVGILEPYLKKPLSSS